MNSEITPRELQQEALAFRAGCTSVIMATSAPDGTPDAGYAPCVLDDQQRCHVLISRLAQHTKNLLARPVVSLMWIEATDTAKNPFARRRLVMRCGAVPVERDSADWSSLIDMLQSTHGNTVPLLAELEDFILFRFEALSGNYVRGFAQAWAVEGNALSVRERRER
jgi:putative heme iron utilization protein